MYYQLEMVLSGFFIRGGWSIGELFINEQILYGYPMIESYKLETQKALNPRIIFSEKMKVKINEHLSFYNSKYLAPQKFHVLKDNDGEYFINYLYCILDYEGIANYNYLKSHKCIIESRMKLFEKNDKILAKYVWCAYYHNYFCNTFINNCPKEYLIPNTCVDWNFSLIP